ncbi:MAG: methyltransferase domain-containing protein [Vicinamibacterales bacterium]|jgi:SAM-dependent methyltransferase|nr:methyltransferase domain-containing protein [Vicinamibacterales bacterium]
MSCAEYACFAEYYDHVVPYRARPDVSFFVDIARAASGPVLEAGCGTGRILLPCARAGVPMVGLDPAVSMLDVLRRKLAEESDEVRARTRVVEGDMRTFELGEQFAAILLPFRSFQHLLTPEDQRAALRRLRAHLRPGGTLVLDLFNPSIPMLGDPAWGRYPIPEPEFTMPDGRKVTRSYRVLERDFVNQRQRVEFIIDVVHPDGTSEHRAEAFAIRYLFRYEAEYLLECEGFRVEAVLGGYDRSPFGTTYPGELILVARA